jgi:hypothetical protein
LFTAEGKRFLLRRCGLYLSNVIPEGKLAGILFRDAMAGF